MAASGAVGAFGLVRAYFGPVESQGRGGIHPHIHLWLVHPMTGRFLARLREGTVEGLEDLLRQWRARVLAKVGTMQFDAAEEVGRQPGLRGDERLPPFCRSRTRRVGVPTRMAVSRRTTWRSR